MATKVGSLEIEIAANIARLTQDFAAAKNEVKKSTGEISGVVIQMQKDIEQSMSGITNSMKALKGIAELGGIAIVGEKIFELGKQAAEYGEMIEQASHKTGIAVGELQGLKFAADLSGVSFEALEKGLGKLARAMMEAQQGNKSISAAFESVGIDASKLKDMKVEDVLALIADKFHGTEDGAAKTAIAMQLFGRAGAEMIPMLDKGSGNIAELTKKAQDLGLILDEDSIAKSAAFNQELKTLSAQTKMAAISFGMDMMPAIKSVTDAMSGALAPGSFLNDVFKGLGIALQVLVVSLTLTWQVMEQWTAVIAGAIVTMGNVINAVLHFDWSGIKSAWTKGMQDIKTVVDQYTDDMRNTINKAKEGMTAPPKDDAPKGGLKIGNADGKDERLAQWRAELDQKKDAEGEFHEMSKAQELAFWRAKLDMATGNTKLYNAVLHEVVSVARQVNNERIAEEVRTIKEISEQQKRDAAERLHVQLNTINEEAALSQRTLKAEDSKNQYLLASHQISEQQKLALDVDAENKSYQIELDALARKLELYYVEPAERAKIDAQLEQLNFDHNQRMLKATQDTALATQKNWEQIFQPVTSAFDTSIKGMIMGTQTLQKAMQNIAQSILAEFVNLGVKMVTEWAARQITMTLATTTGNASRTAADAEGAAASSAASLPSIIKTITNYAAQAFAGVWAALSGIPYVGPVLAAAEAPAAMSTVLGMTGMLSAAGGAWNVPSDQLAMVHKNESILPAHIAQPLRNMVEGGGKPSAGDTHVHLNVSAIDAASFHGYLDQNKSSLMKVMKSMVRSNPHMAFGG
jgi:hypothetical protein